MNLHAVIFTHPPDYAAAALAVQALQRHAIPVTLAVDEAHAPPEIAGVAVAITTFPRNGNLNGRACLDGELALFETIDCDAVLVVDSDTLVLDPDRFYRELPHHPLVGHCWGTLPFLGCCYGIRRSSIPAYRTAIAEHPETDGPEDLMLWQLSAILGIEPYRLPHSKAGPGLTIWNWHTKLTPADYLARFEVITVQRNFHVKDPDLSRAQVVARMQSILNVL